MTETKLAIARAMFLALKRLGADAYALAALDDKTDLYQLAEVLGAPPELLGIVGSYGDTLDDDAVLSMLEDWNAGTQTFWSFLDERH